MSLSQQFFLVFLHTHILHTQKVFPSAVTLFNTDSKCVFHIGTFLDENTLPDN